MDLENIIENINTGIESIKKHLDVFTDGEKEDYFYMINNIDVLIRIAKERK